MDLDGIILLTEQSIKIDDVLEIYGDVVKIQNIGIRTSKALNTDDVSIIIPNSLITTNKVILLDLREDKVIEKAKAYATRSWSLDVG